MASSALHHSDVAPARTPGPLGLNDQGDPSRWSKLGNTPGSLGINDHADPSLSGMITPLLELYKVITPTTKIYDHIALNGRFGCFHYRDIPHSKDARIEVDPTWNTDNIVEMALPSNLRSLTQFKSITYLKVNRMVLNKWIQVFLALSNDSTLLNLVSDLDPGTFYPRHIRKNVHKGISNHSWGAAIDINVEVYPLGSKIDEKTDKDEPNLILFEKVFKPARFSWGNHYKDPMHFEIC